MVENSYTPVVRLLTGRGGGGGGCTRPVMVENSYTPVVRLHTQCTGRWGGGGGGGGVAPRPVTLMVENNYTPVATLPGAWPHGER